MHLAANRRMLTSIFAAVIFVVAVYMLICTGLGLVPGNELMDHKVQQILSIFAVLAISLILKAASLAQSPIGVETMFRSRRSDR